MNVLGLKVIGHDTGASIISDGRIVAISEERLNRIKYSHNIFPELSIKYCLDTLDLKPTDIDLIVIDRYVPDGKTGDSLTVEIFLEKTGEMFKGVKIENVNHHDAHACSAFYCSPFNESAILIYDGAGELSENYLGVISAETDSLYFGRENSFYLIRKILHTKTNKDFLYTTGIGKLYSIISREYLNFGSFNEGKLMGLSGYGDDRVLKQWPEYHWMTEKDGAILCNPKITFKKVGLKDKVKNKSIVKIGRDAYWMIRWRIKQKISSIKNAIAHSGKGTSRSYVNPNIFNNIELSKPQRSKDFPLPDKYYASVAFAVQKVLEKTACFYGKSLKNITESENICIAGGVGLNIDANRNFIDKVGYKNIFVQPAANDSGLPLGCALYGYHVVGKKPRFWEMKSASLGRSYTEDEILEALSKHSDAIEFKKDLNISKTCAKHISNKKIIGWFEGGSEYGPRALGNRSILCDARPEEMKDILNEKVKNREMWRPFATVILRDKLSEWFDFDIDSPFMLLHGNLKKDKIGQIPSVIHVDNTSRIQTVTAENNGRYYELIKEFNNITGTPLLLNTSFNLGGDPIVETPDDALETFLKTKMDYLVLENYLIKKKV